MADNKITNSIDKQGNDTEIKNEENSQEADQELINQLDQDTNEYKDLEFNQPLIHKNSESSVMEEISAIRHRESQHLNNPSLGRIIYEIVTGALPATIGLLFVFITETINIVYIGRYNIPDLISAIGIGTLFVNATGYIPGAGLIGGIDTLCSQSFGAGAHKRIGVYTSIGRLCVFVFFIFVCIPFNFCSYSILIAINQSEEVAELASTFCHLMSFSVFFALQYNTSLRYLQAMNIFYPGMFVTLLTAVLHPLWCYVFIVKLDFGVNGAAICMGLTQGLNLLIISIFIAYHDKCIPSYSTLYWSKWTFKVKYIKQYLNKAVPAAVMFSADWLGFECLTLMSSFLGVNELAANVCLFNFITLIFMIQMGLSIAATTLVGNSVGRKNKDLASKYALATLIIGIVVQCCTTALVIINRSEIPSMYTGEKTVEGILFDLLGIYIIFAVPDSLQIILHGVIKGYGLQTWASVICLVILYPINIPMAYLFAFVWQKGVLGLWYSQMVSVFLMAIAYILLLGVVDLERVIEEAIRRKNIEQIEIIKEIKKDEAIA